MAIDDRRKELRAWIEDMDALKTWAVVGSPQAQPFVDAFAAARSRALVAATAYVEAVKSDASESPL